MIRVLLAEDQTMLRDALTSLLALESDIEIVAAVGTGTDAVDAATDLRPDVALLDIEMPEMDGLAAAEVLADRLPSCRVVIVTTFGRPGYVQRAMAANVAGFISKEARATDVASAIRRVHRGERVIDHDLAVDALRHGVDPLTPREKDVLRAARDLPTVSAVAEQLFLSEGTVRNYLSSAIQKLGSHNRNEAIATAQANGWL